MKLTSFRQYNMISYASIAKSIQKRKEKLLTSQDYFNFSDGATFTLDTHTAR